MSGDDRTSIEAQRLGALDEKANRLLRRDLLCLTDYVAFCIGRQYGAPEGRGRSLALPSGGEENFRRERDAVLTTNYSWRSQLGSE